MKLEVENTVANLWAIPKSKDTLFATAICLSANADVVKDGLFELAVIKLQIRNVRAMPREERLTIAALRRVSESSQNGSDEKISLLFAERAFKAQRRIADTRKQKYLECLLFALDR